MTVKNVIIECLTKMGKDNFLDNTSLSDDEIKMRNDLIKAVNIAYKQVIATYLPHIKKESVVFCDKIVYTTDLDESIIYPIMLKRGDSVERFRAYYDRIEAKFDGEATLTYAFMPDVTLALTSTIEEMELTQNALSNGALKEYYFANKLFELAENFDIEFRNELGSIKRIRNFNLKHNRWLL